MLYALEGKTPKVHPTAFVAENAVVVGEVTVEEKASVWFHAVIRGDLERVVVGRGSNVQDGAILHADPGFPCLLGPNVTVGHRAVVHGAVVEEGALIGIGAIVLNGARIGKNAVVGAGAVVPPGMEVEEGTLVLGVPAKPVRPTDPPTNAPRYQALAERYRKGLKPWDPLPRVRLTLRGEDALNPFSDLHLRLKREMPEALDLLRRLAGQMTSRIREAPFPIGKDEAHLLQKLVQEGLVKVSPIPSEEGPP